MIYQALPDEALVERQLATRGLKLSFAPELEQRFEAETAAGRSRTLFRFGIAGLAVYLIHSLTDLVLIPDVIALALVLHLGVATPFLLAALVLFRLNSPPILREWLLVGTTILCAVITLGLMLASSSPLRDQLATSTFAMMLFLTVVQRARFPYAVAGCAALAILNATALALLPNYEPARLISDVGTLIGSGALMLVACWALEHETRQTYLLRLKERLLNTELDDMSRHDPMTGLENRRSLDLAFRDLSRDAHGGEDIAVVLLDIDYFKLYNDELGHVAGDEALRIVAHELRAGLRAGSDRAFRFGGEEFLLLLRRTSLGDAVLLAERLRRQIETAALAHPRGQGGVVTASFGVASARTGSEIGHEEMVAGADAALYAAKRSGRNQVWPPLPAARPMAADPRASRQRDAG